MVLVNNSFLPFPIADFDPLVGLIANLSWLLSASPSLVTGSPSPITVSYPSLITITLSTCYWSTCFPLSPVTSYWLPPPPSFVNGCNLAPG